MSPGRVVEIIGPPGSGKSTVARALSAGGTGVGLISAYSGAANAPAYLASALRLAAVVPSRPRGPGSARKQLNWMIRLDASPSVRRRARESLVVFDQGPAYTMARLVGVAGRDGWRPRYERWWKEQVAEWAAATDLLVFLDAPDPELVARIRTRRKDHAAKGLDDAAAVAAVRAARAHYDVVAGELAAGGVAVIRIDTTAARVAEIVLRIEAKLSAPSPPSDGARSGSG